ncbi:tetratricopeptide repeat protein [Streptomyces sp. NPDC006339]|uniref:tetratricopeptide repeat protein n=1 Tax=Streptomyces sp. NPDC006339 TaxID=3156755 RepID=UPI0033B4983F
MGGDVLERAEAGDVGAMLRLASVSGVAERARWLLHAAQAESAEALGLLPGAKAELEAAARAGDVDCQNVLGGVLLAWDEDPAGAAVWFRKAAEGGNNEARRSLGYLLVEGAGVEKDASAAERLFRAAAGEGDSIAQYNLAILLLDELARPERRDESLSLLESAARGGVDEAAVRLGDELDAAGDASAAHRWYEAAAEAGNTDAMFAVASRYRDGIGVAVDRPQAVRWFLDMLVAHRFEGIHEIFAMAQSVSDEEIRQGGRIAGRVEEAEKIVEMRNAPSS